MRRVLLILASLLILTAIVMPAALVWSVLFTNQGLRFLVRHLPESIGGVRLEISGISGSIASGLRIEQVEIDHHLVHLKFEDVEARLALAPLLVQSIDIKHGSVRNALIQTKRRTKPPTSHEAPVFLPRWLIIRLDDARVATLAVFAPNGSHVSMSDLHGAAVVRHSTIRFFQAETQLGDAHLSGMGVLRAADPLGLEGNGRLEWNPAGQPHWTVDASGRGDLDNLNVIAQATSPFRAEFIGKVLDLTSHWHLRGEALVEDFDLAAWGLPGPLGSIRAHLVVSGDIDSFSARGQVTPTGLHVGEFDAAFSGSYANDMLTAKSMELRHLDSGARASGMGTIAIVPHGPRFELSGSWTEFRWPLVGRDVAVRSPSGSFTLAGTLPYSVHVTGSGAVADLPPMPVEGTATLDKDRVSFDPAEVDLFGGHATLSGLIVWSGQKSWSVSGRASGINPGALRADLPGKLSFTFAVSGRGFDPKDEFTAAFSNLSGSLRGVGASGAGQLARAGSRWSFSNVRIGLGSASLALDGHLNEHLDLRFALSADDLNVLAPGSRGRIKSSGTLGGTLADPVIVASAHGGDVDYQGIKVEAFDADVNFDPGSLQKPSRIDAQVRGLRYLNRTLESVSFKLRGPLTAYSVRLAATATGLTVRAQARGMYAGGVFTGTINALNASGSQSLDLSLEQPVALTVARDRFRFDWLCLTGSPGSLCGDLDWTDATWSSTLMANQVPIGTLTAGTTPAVDYLGTVSALAHLGGGTERPVQGTVRVELADAEIVHKLVSHKVEHTRIGSGTLNVSATPAFVNATVSLGDGAAGTLRGTFALERSSVRWLDMPLTGELHVQTDEAGLVTLYAPTIDRCQGHLSAEVELGGTLAAPRLTGLVKLSDGEIDVYQVNLGLRQLGVEAHLSDGGFDFTGSAHAGAGTVSARGHIEWRELLPYGKIHLEGTSLRVADVPEAQIDASPDLDFAVAGHKIEVSGKVSVPYAKIQPKDITNAVRASSDEVIVGSEEENPAERFEVTSNITLVLGDKVSIDTLGLSGRVTGSLSISSGYDAITRGTGELSIAEGKYIAYGRKLDIQHGRLIFTSGPIDDPGVDLRAIKQFPDVTAGVNVRGTLLRPRMSFFSDPPLPQSQVVSLILAGGSLESAQTRTAGPGGGAGSAALAQGGAILAQQLGSHVGIEDVGLESDISNTTSLVLGRYLSPRLYVSYGISLTEQLNTFKMRYTLGDHWTVKTELGQAYGADLVYAIERK